MKKTQGKRLAVEMCEKETNDYIFANFPPMTYFDHQQLIQDLLRYGTPAGMSCQRIQSEVFTHSLSKRFKDLTLNNDYNEPDDPMQIDP